MRFSGVERRAFFWSSLVASLPLLFGPLTIVVIVAKYDGVTQGAYYTFTNLTALLLIFLLGDQETVSQKASAVTGANPASASHQPLQELAAGFVAFRIAASALFLTVVGFAGAGLIYVESATSEYEATIWCFYVGLVAVNTVVTFPSAILIGIGRSDEYWRFRAVEFFLYSVTLLTSLSLELGLWALPIAVSISVGLNAMLVSRVVAMVGLPRLRWLHHFRWYLVQIFPLQWRIGLQSVSASTLPRLLVPLVFILVGAVSAGKLAVTLTVGLLASSFAFMLLRVSLPRITAARWKGEDDPAAAAAFSTASLFGVAGQIIFSIAIVLSVYWLHDSYPQIAERFLDPLETAILLIALLGLSLVAVMSTRLRVHLRDFPPGITFLGCGLVLVASAAATLIDESMFAVLAGATAGMWLLYVPLCASYVLSSVAKRASRPS